MIVEYLVRGVKAGVVAGLIFGLLLALVANPVLGYAEGIGHESGTHDHEQSTGIQHDSLVSIFNGISVVSGVLWGILLGAVGFGVAFFFLEPIVPGSGPVKSYVFATAGFLTTSAAPWLAVPPAPPGTTHSLGVQLRLLVYGGMMIAGAVAVVASMLLYGRLQARPDFPTPFAVVGGLVPVAALPVVAAVLPTDRTTVTVPATLADGVVGLTIFGQVLLWLTLAVGHARLTGERARDHATGGVGQVSHGAGGD
ncbi:CbtA family protein [Halobaculum gomorrense]|uniref:Probable cobalt transporter subunit (CbtA) n=1 Tax=Halobaculum gomorrense TaxID=43928 RepID=A0A1M5PHD4_9EURY|nr:CbtA family protein [Halobaculum gomorrense]SHH01131.1 Probable cobalt transporter subunit (CbtA) [Halobaculum gomorrense]